MPLLAANWLRHQHRDDFWKHGSVCEDYAAIQAKVLAVGGWGDAYKNAVPQIVQNIPGAKGIIGPWVHKYPHFAVPEPRIGFLQEAVRWWDRWLKGIDTDVENDPPLRVYQMDGVRPARWYTERPGQWLALQHMQRNEIHGPITHYRFEQSGQLSTEAQSPQQIERPMSSPAHCGAQAGEYCAIWLGPELAGDQRADDALSLTWDSDPLPLDKQITGAPRVFLRVRSTTPQAQIAVRLCHVHPDGASTLITYGVRNLCRSPNGERAYALDPDNIHDGTVELDHVAYTVPKGHRLRVSISNAYWPLLWPSPERGTVTVVKGNLALPAPVREPATPVFSPPDSALPLETEELRPETHIRRQETDLVSGVVSLVIEDDFGKSRDLGHGLVTGSIARERWSIHPDDPLSAHGQCHWTDEMERDDIRLRTEARCEMTSDATHFHLRAHLQAFENDVEVFSKEIEDSIPRDHL